MERGKFKSSGFLCEQMQQKRKLFHFCKARMSAGRKVLFALRPHLAGDIPQVCSGLGHPPLHRADGLTPHPEAPRQRLGCIPTRRNHRLGQGTFLNWNQRNEW